MWRGQLGLLAFYLYGFWLVFLQSVIFAVLIVWALQVFALAFGEQFDWGDVLRHLILTVSFAIFFPGQKFWTFQMEGPDGKMHTIVGDPKTETPKA